MIQVKHRIPAAVVVSPPAVGVSFVKALNCQGAGGLERMCVVELNWADSNVNGLEWKEKKRVREVVKVNSAVVCGNKMTHMTNPAYF